MSINRSSVLLVTLLVATGTVVAATGTTPATLDPDQRTVGGDAVGVVSEHVNESFDVSNLEVSTDDGQVTVTADISNPDGVPQIQNVELRVQGDLVERRGWALNPGETETITFQVPRGALNEGDVISVLTRNRGEVTTFEAGPPPVTASVTFEDQTSDGTSAVVANVSNGSTPYYAAVWTLNESTSEPETLLGFEQITQQQASNVTVDFSEATIDESQTLVAAVHPDRDGNASTVDPDTENILAFDTANVTVEAEPPAGASVTFEDQTSDGTNAVIANVSNGSTPYYAAVWTLNASTNDPETLLGFEQLNDTEASNVSVDFSEATIDESQTLVAAVHPDQDGNVSTVDPNTTRILAFDTANVTVEEAPPANVTASVTFEDQTSDGTSAVVASVSNGSTPYYAAVWTLNESSDEPDQLLGAVQLDDLEASNVSVDFTAGTIDESQTLVAAVHPDQDGLNATFDPNTERILAADTANVTVEEAPPANVTAGVTFEDQTSDGTSAVVANVSNGSTPYYAAVWTVNDSTSEPETLLGFEQLSETEASNVSVDFSEATIDESQTLVAAVHPDQDGNASTVDPNTARILAADTANVTVETGPPFGPTISFEDQTSDGTSAVVASVSRDITPYYAAVWTVNASTGEPDQLLGFEQLNDTEASNVSVNFTEATIDESQTLVAAVHPDRDGNASTVDPNTARILVADTANVTVDMTNDSNDLDGDGKYEDVNGDGVVTVLDAQLLFVNLRLRTVHSESYDFNGDGTVDVLDVQALFVQN